MNEQPKLSELIIQIGKALASWSQDYCNREKITPPHLVTNMHVFLQNEEVYRPLLVVKRICDILLYSESGRDDWAAMLFAYIQAFKDQGFSEYEAIFYTTMLFKLKWDDPPIAFPDIEMATENIDTDIEEEENMDGRDYGDETGN